MDVIVAAFIAGALFVTAAYEYSREETFVGFVAMAGGIVSLTIALLV